MCFPRARWTQGGSQLGSSCRLHKRTSKWMQKASNDDREGTGGQERREGTAGNTGLVANWEHL